MRNLLLRLTFALLAAISVTAQTVGWREYKNLGGNFSVLLPGEPRLSTETQGANTIHTVLSLVDSLGYIILYTKNERDQAPDEASYKSFKELFLKGNSQCSVVSEQPAAPVLNGYIGHLYRLHCERFNMNMTLFGNLYTGKHYSYAVMGMFGTTPTDPPEIKKFVNSFSLVDPIR